MGEMADMALELCIQHEAEWDDYHCGFMSDEDAFESGIIDSQGYADSAQMERVIERNKIPTVENMNNELSHAIKDLTIASSQQVYPSTPLSRSQSIKNTLNEAAIANLKKPNPTCNWCGQQMPSREGKYGKFYFCANRCPGQKTVSDSYWQSIKRGK